MVRERSKLILLDILNGTLYAEKTAVEGNFLRPPLRLSFSSPHSTGERPKVRNALKTIQRLQKESDWSKAHVVIGIQSDPFAPFTEKFDLLVKCLEEMALKQPGHITLQTRSPLIVLALPLLKRFGDRLSLVMAFEALNNSINSTFTPHLPRPSERITAARTLHRFGLDVHLQIAPIVGTRGQLRGLSRKVLSQFVTACDTAATSLEIVSLPSIVETTLSPMLMNARFGGEFQRISHLALREMCRTELKRAELVVSADFLSDVAA